MTIDMLHPAALWLLLALIPLAWVARGRLPRGRIALRMVLMACAIVALALPGVSWRSDRAHRVFVLDQKAQLGEAARSRARAVLARRIAALGDTAGVSVVQLGGDRTAVGVPTVRVPGASLSAALAAAEGAIPAGAGGTVTLISDGRSSDRHWARSVAALVRRGIAVDAVALAPPPAPPFIADVAVDTARPGEAAVVRVNVEGRGAVPGVTLYLDGRVAATAPGFAVDGARAMAMRLTAPGTGFHRLRATLNGGAGGFDTLLPVQAPGRLLYLGERQAGAAARLRALIGGGLAIDAPDAAAIGPAFDFARYDVVMIDDLPAARLPAAQQRRLIDAVRANGTGLFYAGGRGAFGGGGWDRTPLAAALPLTIRAEERVEKPSVALAVVIDSSGSMGGDRLDLAKQMAVLAARKLGPQDQFGVVEFYGAKQWAVPMQPVRDIAAIERAIGRMQAQGSSVLFPAVQEAYYAIKDVDARYRHILVISDGDVTGGQFEQLLRHIAEQRINVSTAVTDGREADLTRMMEWARWGRGRFFSIPDASGLVQVDLSPPQVKPQPGYRDGVAALRVAPGHSWWSDLAIGAPPPVAGHVRVGARDGAETLVATTDGDPLLTSWQYGSGRITTLATEPLGEGTRGWAGWPRYGAWLGRTIARTARPAGPLTGAATRTFDRIALSVSRPAGDGVPEAWLLDPAGRPVRRIALSARAPGLFTGETPWPAARDALIRVRDGEAELRLADRARSDVADGALSAAGALPIADLAARTGGRLLGQDDPATRVSGGDIAYRALWPWLALAALLLYLFDIGFRRWPRRSPVLPDRSR